MSSPNPFRLFCLISTAFCALTGGTAGNAEAQDLRRFFSLSTPGARANAMGRAFIGIADDVTATVTNPAGLVQLTRPQVYTEFKGASYDEVGFRPAKFAVSFLGASTPVGGAGSVAFSYHEYYRRVGDDEIPGVSGRTYAGSIAAPVGDKIRVGATAGLSRLDAGELFSENAMTVNGGIIIQADEYVTVGFSGGGTTDRAVAPARFGMGLGFRVYSRGLIVTDVEGVWYDEATGSSFALHIGGEYLVIAGDTRVFLRAGFHGSSLDDDPFTEESSETLGTFGVGLSGSRIQLDVAFLTRNEAVVSAAFRF